MGFTLYAATIPSYLQIVVASVELSQGRAPFRV